jgi:hypothetical protein
MKGKTMSGTIKAIERHMIPRVKSQTVQPREMRLTGEWQRGFETMSGYAQRKLRLVFVPAQSLATANH